MQLGRCGIFKTIVAKNDRASEARVPVDIPVHAAQDEAKVLYLHHLENVQQCPVPPWK